MSPVSAQRRVKFQTLEEERRGSCNNDQVAKLLTRNFVDDRKDRSWHHESDFERQIVSGTDKCCAQLLCAQLRRFVLGDLERLHGEPVCYARNSWSATSFCFRQPELGVKPKSIFNGRMPRQKSRARFLALMFCTGKL
jgi:hypothetical protein